MAVWLQKKGFCASAIGTKGLDVRGFQTLQHLGPGMTKGVAGADADHRFLRSDGGKERRGGRGTAAVVAHLEQGHRGEAAMGEHSRFTGSFGIAFKEDTGAVILQPHHKRIVVGGLAGIAVPGFACEDRGIEAAPAEVVAGAEGVHRNPEGMCLGEDGTQGGGLAGDHAVPEFAWAKITQDGGHATDVVTVSVGDEDGVEAADATGPEIGCDDLLADVPASRDAADRTPGIDEQGATLGRDDEERVALTDVDGGDLERTGV